jgi:hypothetical protein
MEEKTDSEYHKKTAEVMDIFNKTGSNLYQAGKIMGYSASTDRIHHTISKEPCDEWGEYPAAYSVFKFGDDANPRYLVLSAILNENKKDEFALTHDFFESFPDSSYEPSRDRLMNVSFEKKDLCIIVENLMRGGILAGHLMKGAEKQNGK